MKISITSLLVIAWNLGCKSDSHMTANAFSFSSKSLSFSRRTCLHMTSTSSSTSSSSSSNNIHNKNNQVKESSSKSKSQSKSNSPSKSKSNSNLEMPWSEWQEWALNDNLSKYLVTIDDTQYALWHTMIREVTELSGYNVAFVRKMHARSLSTDATTFDKKTTSTTKKKNNNNDHNKDSPTLKSTPKVLPLLDEFQFEPNGGITGKAYGLMGIANGAMIQTPPLRQSQMSFTIPNGYVLLEESESESDLNDDSYDINDDDVRILLAYELGLPLGLENESLWSTQAKRSRMLKTLASTVTSTATTTTTATISTTPNINTNANANALQRGLENLDSQQISSSLQTLGVKGLQELEKRTDNNGEGGDTAGLLVNLGGVTALLLAGATIMNAFHHHLTVNVFWV